MPGVQADEDPWAGGNDPWSTPVNPPANFAASANRSDGRVNDAGTVSHSVPSSASKAVPPGSNHNANGKSAEDPWVHSDPWSASAASAAAAPTKADRPPQNGSPAFKEKWGTSNKADRPLKNGSPAFQEKWGTSNKVPKGRGGGQVKQKTQLNNWFSAAGRSVQASTSEPAPPSEPPRGAGRGRQLIVPAHMASTVLGNAAGPAAPSFPVPQAAAPMPEAIVDPLAWDSIWNDDAENKQPTAVPNYQPQPTSLPITDLGFATSKHSFEGLNGNAPAYVSQQSNACVDCHVPAYATALENAEAAWWTSSWFPAVTSTPSTFLLQMECRFKENYEAHGPGEWLPQAANGDIAVIRCENPESCYVESLECLRPGKGWVPKECVELETIPPYYEFTVLLQGQENDLKFPIGIVWTEHRFLGEFLEIVSLTGLSSIQNYNRNIRDIFPRDQLMVGDMIVSANGQKGVHNMTELLNAWDWQNGSIHIRVVRIKIPVLQAINFHLFTTNRQPAAIQPGAIQMRQIESAVPAPIHWQ